MNFEELLRVGLCGALCATVTVACGDPLLEPELIRGLRIAGARAQADGEPQRAQLAEGEDASISWLVVADEPRRYAARAVWCLAEQTRYGLQRCRRAPFDEQTLEADANAEATFSFQVPDARGASSWLGWFGVCEGEAPEFDWRDQAFQCEDGSAALQGVYESAFLSPGETANEHPDLSDDELTFDGQPWPVDDLPPGQPCADLDVPRARLDEAARLVWRAGGEDRQALQVDPSSYAAPTRESLTFTHLATAPGLERAFSALTWDSAERGFELEFRLADVELPSEGRTVSVILIASDERGGSDWEHRTLCAMR